MDPKDPRILRAARQHAKTTKLLGVDFMPLPRAGRPAADTGPAAAQSGVAPPRAPEVRAAPTGIAQPAASGKAAALASLRERHDRECPHCTRATAHTRTVFGDGSAEARLMFIGEAPGADEDREGIPFVGRSGQLLNQMIEAMGFSRATVYIANVLKARPPNNDTPTGEEAAKCGPYLAEQVRIIAPEVIVTLGNPATQYILDTKQGITSLRGRWQTYNGVPVMPTFHPAYLLRNYTPENRKLVWSDLQQVMVKLGSSATAGVTTGGNPPTRT